MRFQQKHWSLVAKLTAAYLTAAAVILIGSIRVLDWTLSRNLEKVEIRLLDQKIDFFLQDQGTEPDDYKELFQQVSTATRGRDPQQYWVRFLDASGRSLAETPGMTQRIPTSLFDNGRQYDTGRWTKRVHLGDGRLYRLSSATSKSHGSPLNGIQLAIDCQRDVDLLTEFRARLGLVVGIGLALLAAAATWIARQGLRPLGDLGHLIRRQDADSLSKPIDPTQWPPETRELIESYNDLSLRLHESFQRLSQFSADLAHELRTPIHNLRLQADVTLSRPRKLVEYKTALENAKEEYDRLTNMTESLLFLARAENGKQGIRRARLDALREMDSVLRRFTTSAAGKGVRLTAEGRASLTADPELLQLALGNLLANALTNTPKGGKIDLIARKGRDGGTRVTVQDSGVGVDAAHLTKIFDRFYRADPARTSNSGSGLGLSLVQAVMALHGGTVEAQSEVGHGLKITLEFPADTSTADL